MTKNILHICYVEKFIPDFINLVREKVLTNNHTFITMGSNYDKYPVREGRDLIYLPGRYLRNFSIIKEMNKADKVMMHGLFDPGVIILLFFQPWLLKKCYWVIWGGDIYYTPGKNLLSSFVEYCKVPVAKNMGYLVSLVEGDIEYTRKKYGAQGQYKRCITYLSNCYKKVSVAESESEIINVQVGNSADIENDHAYILDKLRKISHDKMKIFAPLSYGDNCYAKEISVLGHEYFGENYTAMYDFMSLQEYTKWQFSIDIAIFAHNRQQGMGNIITLLGLGKSVYMRSGVSSTLALKKMGLKIGEVDKEEIKVFSSGELTENMKIIEKEFSVNNLVEQLTTMFD